MSELVVDADGRILGRLAASIAQRLKDGDTVHVVNAEEAIVTGEREAVFEDYRQKRERGNRDHGPYFPKAPDRILKRTVKGMLPDSDDGREAFKRLKTYSGTPDGLDADETELDVRSASDLQGSEYVSLQEITNHM